MGNTQETLRFGRHFGRKKRNFSKALHVNSLKSRTLKFAGRLGNFILAPTKISVHVKKRLRSQCHSLVHESQIKKLKSKDWY